MAVQWKKGSILAGAAFIAASFGGYYAISHGLFNPGSAGPAAIPVAAPLPELAENTSANNTVSKVALPSKEKVNLRGPEVRFQEMAWQSQTGVNFANGGVYTTSGSLMEKHNVNLHIVWQDDVNAQMTALVNFAASLKKGNPHPTEGAHFAALMGDGSAAMIGGVSKELQDLGMDPEIVGSFGFSRGEDQLMGPPTWKQTPKLARGGQGGALPPDAKGGLVSGFLRDGDWNIALKWASDNGIKNNPDEKTWDPDAINWLSADDYIKAADAYINNVCEDRPVVINGKRNGETVKVCVNAVVTWTPGDVNVAEQKGGLATIVSTKQYRSQMPNTVIGIKQWNQANKDLVVEFLAAGFEGGEQVRAYPEALRRGAEANADIWPGAAKVVPGQSATDYWVKYFKGVTVTDKQGVTVDLGGSSVNTLQDNLVLYGMAPGSTNVFAAVYDLFGNIVKQQYPKLTPDLLPVSKVLNTEYVETVRQKYGTKLTMAADLPKFNANNEMKQVVSKRAWSINFQTGSSSFSPDSLTQLNELKNGLLVAGDLAIEIYGHTDNTGNADNNVALSQARANAVKNWLIQQSSTDFNPDRFLKVQGFGQNKPVATNDTDTGRAKNRRVEVVLGTN